MTFVNSELVPPSSTSLATALDVVLKCVPLCYCLGPNCLYKFSWHCWNQSWTTYQAQAPLDLQFLPVFGIRTYYLYSVDLNGLICRYYSSMVFFIQLQKGKRAEKQVAGFVLALYLMLLQLHGLNFNSYILKPGSRLLS